MPVNAFTISSNNYLGMARVFAESYLAHHPGAKDFTCLVDRRSSSIDYGDLPFEIITAEDLEIPGFLEWNLTVCVEDGGLHEVFYKPLDDVQSPKPTLEEKELERISEIGLSDPGDHVDLGPADSSSLIEWGMERMLKVADDDSSGQPCFTTEEVKERRDRWINEARDQWRREITRIAGVEL
jgi:hypothetical protein